MTILEPKNRLEFEVFGVSAVFDGGFPEYKSFQSSIEEVKSHQPSGWDITDPNTEIARLMYRRVRFSLVPKFRHELVFCCALGTSLDYWHGIDGFFQTTRKGCVGIASFDLTMSRNPEKVRNLKADIRISDSDLDKSFLTVCDQLAKMLNERVATMRIINEVRRKRIRNASKAA